MAYITKRGSSYSVRYTYFDEHGKSCDKWEKLSHQRGGDEPQKAGGTRACKRNFPDSVHYNGR